MPARHAVMKYVCKKETSECCIVYTGEKDAIFFWTKETAVVVEMGYDFLHHLLEIHGNFGTFFKDMDSKYKTFHHGIANFISVSTFENCFLKWAAALQIDFRTSSDPFCGSSPKQLACDGTHIRISFRQLQLHPIDSPDVENALECTHRRYDRVFLPYRNRANKDMIRESRQNLLHLCMFYVQMDGERLSIETTADIVECFDGVPLAQNFIIDFIDDNFPVDLRTAASRFMTLLLRDAPISAVIPFSVIANLREKISALKVQPTLINNISKFVCSIGPELDDLLNIAASTPFIVCVCDFILYLCSSVVNVHKDDRPEEAISPIEGSYDPESGVCYYFSGDGKKVRQLPKYDIADYKETCTKLYSRVRKQGWGHLFVWLCAEHGHVYGYHLISGSEGRKDVFASAYQFMNEAPAHIYYDYSCALSDYCLNREPHFFRNTRFWIDNFHLHNHVCGDNHKPARVEGIQHPNTSICEQFNSYLSCFKYFCNHLTQSHFCFLLQIFVHIWNEKKTVLCNKRVSAENKAVL